jgi:hypothetical protein
LILPENAETTADRRRVSLEMEGLDWSTGHGQLKYEAAIE